MLNILKFNLEQSKFLLKYLEDNSNALTEKHKKNVLNGLKSQIKFCEEKIIEFVEKKFEFNRSHLISIKGGISSSKYSKMLEIIGMLDNFDHIMSNKLISKSYLFNMAKNTLTQDPIYPIYEQLKKNREIEENEKNENL